MHIRGDEILKTLTVEGKRIQRVQDVKCWLGAGCKWGPSSVVRAIAQRAMQQIIRVALRVTDDELKAVIPTANIATQL